MKITAFTQIRRHVRTPLYFNGYALMLSTATTSILGLVYWVLAARYYDPHAVGINSAAISAITLLSAVTQLNLNGALIRFIPRTGRRTARFVASVYGISIALAVVGGLIFNVVVARWFPQLQTLGASSTMILYYTLAVIVWSLFVLQDNVLSGLRQSVWIPVENTLYSIFKLLLLIVFAHTFTTYGILVSWIIPICLSIVPINWLIFGRLIPRHVEATKEQEMPLAVGYLARFVAGNYIGGLFLIMSTTLLPILVTHRAGPSANAYFYLPWVISSSLTLVATNLSQSLAVESALDPSKLGGFTYRILLQCSRLLVPIILVTVLGAPLILRIYGTDYSEQGSTLLRLLALAALPNIANTVYLSIARVQHRIISIIIVQACLCVIVLGLSYVLLPIYGITGVGIAWFVSQTVVAAILLRVRLFPILQARNVERLDGVPKAVV